MILDFVIGNFYSDVLLELIRDCGVSRPRMKPVNQFPADFRVEVSRQLRENFPIGTKFESRVKICQKHVNGKPNGPPYLRVYDIGVIVSSIKEKGIVAKLDPTGVDGRKYYYKYE